MTKYPTKYLLPLASLFFLLPSFTKLQASSIDSAQSSQIELGMDNSGLSNPSNPSNPFENNYFANQSNKQKNIAVNNRILAKVNGNCITVLDVMKKMDFVFYKQYEQYADSTEIRYEFYKVNWQPFLEEMINKELILLDAKELKISVAKGDVRQEIERLFGPDIITNLEKLHLDFNEVWNMIETDLKIQRIMYSKVNFKANNKVLPQLIKEEYTKYLQENKKINKLSYRILSIKDPNHALGAQLSQQVYDLLTVDKLPLENITEYVTSKLNLDSHTKFQVSQTFENTPKSLSKNYSDALKLLKPLEFSKPIAQKSKSTGATIYRIFYLESVEESPIDSFHEQEGKIKEKLFEKAFTEEMHEYITLLRNKFYIQESNQKKENSTNFLPFKLYS